DRIKRTFIKRYAVAQGTNVVGRLIPFGIGAVIGGGGNHLLGRQIVRTAREGFGPAPASFPSWLEPVIREPKAPKPPRDARPQGQRRELRIPLPALPRRGDKWVESPEEYN
ncbi:MAG: hypothetical protein ACKVOG_09440, partial [Rhodoglobus sp.]